MIDGTADPAGFSQPDLLDHAPIPATFCKLLYRDGRPHDFVYLYANRAYEESIGIHGVAGRLTSELIPHSPPANRAIMRAYARVVRTGKPEAFEFYSHTNRRWITAQIASPLPEHFFALFTGMSSRVPGDRLRSTFDAMAEGFYVRDRNGLVVDHNPAAERILGVTADDLRGQWPPRQGRGFRRDGTEFPRSEWPSLRTLDTGEPLRDQVMGVRRSEGVMKWLSFNTQPIGGKPGRPDYVVTTFVDITERVNAEQQRLKTLESIGDGYLAFDQNWRFRYVNEAAERLLRVPRASLLGQVQWERYPETLGTAVEVNYRATAAGKPTAFEYEDARSRRLVSVRCFPRESGGIDVFFTEETEARQAREALRQSNDELRRLVSKMSTVEAEERLRIAREIHDDLQQSLAAVRLELGTILKLGGTDSRIGELARDASRHLGAVIDSTRRIVRDLRPPELDAIGLSAALESMLERTRALTGLEARMLPLCAPGPETAIPQEIAYCLYRIAQEALNNVHKHARARSVEVSLNCASPDGVRLTVRDDGLGFQPEDLQRDDSFGVLGMRERVTALGGSLSIEPVADGGTLVAATIPLSR